jgi:murein DD-endopeptidase MepM/ murein hydrolase activator NlpD
MKKNIIFFLILIPFIFDESNIYSWTWPMSGGQFNAPLTSPFGPRRLSSTYIYDWHNGVDMRNWNTNEVIASMDGFTDWITNLSGYGNIIYMGEALYNYATAYAHLTDFLVEQDEYIYEGTQIAECDNLYQDHFHFEYYSGNILLATLGATPPSQPPLTSTRNPMGHLPYSSNLPDLTNPELGTDSDGTYVQVITSIHDTELDFDELELFVTGRDEYGWLYHEEVLLLGEGINNKVKFDERLNCSTLKKVSYYPIENGIKIITQDFDPGNDQVLTFRFYLDPYVWQSITEATAYASLTDQSEIVWNSFIVQIYSGFHPPIGAPDPPTGLLASSNTSSMTVDLAWDEHPDPTVQYFVVYRRPDYTSSPLEAEVIGITYTNSFKDDYETTPGQGYYYSVAAINEMGEGLNSSEILAAMPSYGYITSNRVWQGNIELTGYVTVNSGVTLTVNSGAQIRFAPGKKLTINGTLIANGTIANPIVFTSLNASPSPGDWQGIRFTNGNNGSVLDYCEISYATNGLYVDNTNIDVKHSYIHHNSYSGILELNGSDIFLQYNTIANAYYGLACRYDVDALLGKYNTRGGNRIHNHSVGVECSYNSYMVLGRPDWYPAKNSVYNISGTYLAEALFGGNILALITWWGTPNPPSYRFLYSGYGGTIDHSMPLSSDPGYGSPLEETEQSEKITDAAPPVIDPNNLQSLYEAGDYYRWENETNKAEGIWKQLIENFQESEYAVKALVQLYHLSKGSETNNFDLYLKNIRNGEKVPTALYRKAMILETYLCLSEGEKNAALSLAKEMTNDRHKGTQAELYGLYTLAMSDDKGAQDALNSLKECYPNNSLTNIACEQHNETVDWSDTGKGDYIESEKILPEKLALYENYPNPFNPRTIIQFSIPEELDVSLKIYNILGEEVSTLVSERLSANSYSYEWDASNFASGVYIYRFQAGNYVKTKKMILMK